MPDIEQDLKTRHANKMDEFQHRADEVRVIPL
jgi:hypothetical protein